MLGLPPGLLPLQPAFRCPPCYSTLPLCSNHLELPRTTPTLILRLICFQASADSVGRLPLGAIALSTQELVESSTER